MLQSFFESQKLFRCNWVLLFFFFPHTQALKVRARALLLQSLFESQWLRGCDWAPIPSWHLPRHVSLQSGARWVTGVCWRMLTYADECWRMLTYADVCWQAYVSIRRWVILAVCQLYCYTYFYIYTAIYCYIYRAGSIAIHTAIYILLYSAIYKEPTHTVILLYMCLCRYKLSGDGRGSGGAFFLFCLDYFFPLIFSPFIYLYTYVSL